jgi:hypothetical protein
VSFWEAEAEDSALYGSLFFRLWCRCLGGELCWVMVAMVAILHRKQCENCGMIVFN